MFKKTFYLLSISLLLITCKEEKGIRISAFLEDCPSITGKQEYPNLPYVTAGNRLHMVGHQNGAFSNLEWPIKVEMAGIWIHPIKLMDGFDIYIDYGDKSYPLNNADTFTNYPFANKHQFKIKEKNLSIERLQFVPDNTEGIAIQLEIFNHGTIPQEFDISFSGHSNLRPTWLGEQTKTINGQDIATFNSNIDGWVVKDQNNPWFVCYSASIQSDFHTKSPKSYDKMGASNIMGYTIAIKPNESKTIMFVIAGSYKSEKTAITTLQNILNSIPSLLIEKKERYKQLANQTKLTLPNKKLEQTFEWLKYNSDWLVYKAPEFGSDIGADLPHYPSWFGVDSERALQAYMSIGQTDAVSNTIKLSDSISNTTNDSIISLPADVLAIAENNYNNPNNALNYLEQLTHSFSYTLPGRISDASPEYGMSRQKWNMFNFAYPIVHQFFGIQPNTVEKKIVIKPQMPNDWGEASIEKVAIGDNTISIYFSQNKKSITIRTLQTNWDWSFEVILPRKHKNDGLSVRLGEDVSITNDQFKVSAVNGEIDTAVYFAEH